MPRLPGSYSRLLSTDTGQLLSRTTDAWEVFVSSGRFSRQRPRSVIAESWQRCLSAGIKHTEQRAPGHLSPERVEYLIRTGAFGLAGRQTLDSYAAMLDETGLAIVLGDAQGHILYAVGQQRVLRGLEKINFMPGANWNESVVGPNGIGTPLQLGHPELILGTEHYCIGWQPWVCYGAPVRDPDRGEILGVVDITGPVHGTQIEVLALTTAIARGVEQCLELMHLKRGERLNAAFRDARERWPGDGLVLLSAGGRVLDHNGQAADLLHWSEKSAIRRHLQQLNPSLWQALEDLWDAGGKGEVRLDGDESALQAAVLHCRVEPVHGGNGVIGGILNISGIGGLSRQPRRALARSPAHYRFADILGRSPALLDALAMARAAARDPGAHPVLITGETGTGKELVAHAIHAEGLRGEGPFICLNCAALPADLAEAELFGHVAGAFTGASRQGRQGRIESADGGTLFLDEIDSLPLPLQTKFLRVLEDRQVSRLGSSTSKAIDFRLVTASGSDLQVRIDQGTFRLDLYHRLNILEVCLPPLRERGEDIIELARKLLREAGNGRADAPRDFSTQAREVLCRHAWPGNIRELRNLCTRLAITCGGPEVTLDMLPDTLVKARRSGLTTSPPKEDLRSISDAIIEQTLAEQRGHIGRTATALGISRTTVYRRLKHRRGS